MGISCQCMNHRWPIKKNNENHFQIKFCSILFLNQAYFSKIRLIVYLLLLVFWSPTQHRDSGVRATFACLECSSGEQLGWLIAFGKHVRSTIHIQRRQNANMKNPSNYDLGELIFFSILRLCYCENVPKTCFAMQTIYSVSKFCYKTTFLLIYVVGRPSWFISSFHMVCITLETTK